MQCRPAEKPFLGCCTYLKLEHLVDKTRPVSTLSILRECLFAQTQVLIRRARLLDPIRDWFCVVREQQTAFAIANDGTDPKRRFNSRHIENGRVD